MAKKVRLNFYVDEGDAKRFRELCGETGCTMSEMFRRFITSYIELWRLNKYIPRELLRGSLTPTATVIAQLRDVLSTASKDNEKEV